MPGMTTDERPRLFRTFLILGSLGAVLGLYLTISDNPLSTVRGLGLTGMSLILCASALLPKRRNVWAVLEAIAFGALIFG